MRGKGRGGKEGERGRGEKDKVIADNGSGFVITRDVHGMISRCPRGGRGGGGADARYAR